MSGCRERSRKFVSLRELRPARFPDKVLPGSKYFTFDFSWVRDYDEEEQLSIMDSSESSAFSITGVLLAVVLLA